MPMFITGEDGHLKEISTAEWQLRQDQRRNKAQQDKDFAASIVSGLDDDELWALKQELAGPGRYYGDGGTIHNSTELDVETYKGNVVAVWFRCQMLPFRQIDVDSARAEEMRRSTYKAGLTGVEVIDDPKMG